MELTILNLDTNNSIIFDNENMILNNINSDETQVTHSKSKTIKQIGEYVKASSVSSRPISIIGYILGKSEADLKQRKEDLLNLINPLQNLKLIVDNEKFIEVKATSTVLWGKNWDNNNDQYAKFSLSFTAPNTLWLDLEPTIVKFSPWQNDLIFPLSIPKKGMIFGHRTRDKFTTVYNKSNVPLGCTFTLTCLADVVNPCINNVTHNTSLQLVNLTLQKGQELIISTDFNKKSITLDGQPAIGYFDFTNSDWLMVESGTNIFSYSTENKADNSLSVEIEFYQAYWGVV